MSDVLRLQDNLRVGVVLGRFQGSVDVRWLHHEVLVIVVIRYAANRNSGGSDTLAGDTGAAGVRRGA